MSLEQRESAEKEIQIWKITSEYFVSICFVVLRLQQIAVDYEASEAHRKCTPNICIYSNGNETKYIQSGARRWHTDPMKFTFFVSLAPIGACAGTQLISIKFASAMTLRRAKLAIFDLNETSEASVMEEGNRRKG